MAKVKVEVVGAYVDGHAPGSKIEVEERSAKYLERIGYAKILVQEASKPAPKKTTTPRKKPATKKAEEKADKK